MTPLHYIGETIRELLLRIPLEAVRAAFLLFILALLLWVLFLPRGQVEKGQGRPVLSENLKVWAALALAIQLLVYSFL